MQKNSKENKTIKISAYFWTNVEGRDGSGEIEMPKKVCWDSGFVSIVSNNKHGIRSGTQKSFKNIEDIPNAIRHILKMSGIKAVDSTKSKTYKEALKKIKEAELDI